MIRHTYTGPAGILARPTAVPMRHRDEVESFICLLDDGWYVEYRDGENGPFASLKEAQDYRETHPQRASS